MRERRGEGDPGLLILPKPDSLNFPTAAATTIIIIIKKDFCNLLNLFYQPDSLPPGLMTSSIRRGLKLSSKSGEKVFGPGEEYNKQKAAGISGNDFPLRSLERGVEKKCSLRRGIGISASSKHLSGWGGAGRGWGGKQEIIENLRSKKRGPGMTTRSSFNTPSLNTFGWEKNPSGIYSQILRMPKKKKKTPPQ